MSFELSLMQSVSVWLTHPWVRMFMVVCARWLIFVLPLMALVGWKLKLFKRHALVETVWSTLLAMCLAFGGEIVFARPRPFIVDSFLTVLVPRPTTMSFPSAHASIAFAIAFALFGANRRLGVLALIVADLVAIGRVGTGVHYPTDVLAGLLVGAVSFTIVRIGHEWVRSSRSKKIVDAK